MDGQLDDVLLRVDDQIAYYGRRSRQNRAWFYLLGLVELVAAAFIPLLALIRAGAEVIAVVGVLIVVIQGTILLFQFQQNWTLNRVTGEALKQERALYLGSAGPYRHTSDPRALFVERTENLMRREHAIWEAAQKEEAGRADREPRAKPGDG